jgi:LmbE family N-acetylglucosaminyl deacetylase
LSLTLIRRTALFSLLLPCLYFGTASAAFLYRIHAGNSARTNVSLPALPPVESGKKLLIFSPHPDDETLGAAGLIQQAVKSGASVQVVMLTNGDGFRVAVERQFRQLQVEPKDYVAFADLRQHETFDALANLGLSRDKVTFLGYPDRGLLALWNENWSADRPYTSPYTKCDRSPYKLAYRQGAPYCGQSLLDDIKQILRSVHPTDVFITHPSDDHPDHSAASSFVTLALQQLKAEDKGQVADCKLHYYLVHRGDWPAPQGLYKEDALVPPSEMMSLDTSWRSLPLTEQQVDRKAKSILDYASQTAVMKRFLISFARRNELFGELHPATIPAVPSDKMGVDADVTDWTNVTPVVRDAVNDNLLRDFQGGGDIRAIYACRDAAKLYLRIDTYQPITDQVEFRLGFRYFGDAGRSEAGGSYAITLRGGRPSMPQGATVSARGNHLEIAVPLRDLGYARRMALTVDTAVAGIQIDRTGYRFLTL